MYFLVDDNKKVVARCKNQNEVSMMVLNFFSACLKVPAVQTVSWDIVLKDGYFYYKDGDEYELREYKISHGLIYNGLYYNVIGKYRVSEFDGKQKSTLKASYLDAVNSTVVVDKPAEPPCPSTPRKIPQK